MTPMASAYAGIGWTLFAALITTLLAVALIALLAPFVMKGLGRFKANED